MIADIFIQKQIVAFVELYIYASRFWMFYLDTIMHCLGEHNWKPLFQSMGKR